MIFIYKCLSCGKPITLEQMKEKIRCPYCGYRILTKARPKTSKKIKAV